MTSVHRSVVDLAIVALWTAVAGFAVYAGTGGPARLVLLVPLATLFPGYALVSLFYPGRPKGTHAAFDHRDRSLGRAYASGDFLPGPERLAMSLVTSLVVVPAVVLAANFSPWGLALEPILVGLVGVTLALTAAATATRLRLPPEERYRPPLPRRSWFRTRTAHRSLGQQRSLSVSSVAVVVSLLFLTSTVGYALVAPPQPPGFTELYVQSGDVDAETESLYPSTFTQGEPRTLRFSVANHEHEAVTYAYVVELQRVERQDGDADVRERSRVSAGSLTVEDGAVGNVSTDVRPDLVGDELRLVVFLYEGEVPPDPTVDDAYRVLRLPVDVLAGGRSDSEASLATVGGG
jgi:uncharacterized membrane protein